MNSFGLLINSFDEKCFVILQRQEKERETHREQLPPKPPTPGGMFNKLGAHDRQRDKLNEERKEEYNRLINEV